VLSEERLRNEIVKFPLEIVSISLGLVNFLSQIGDVRSCHLKDRVLFVSLNDISVKSPHLSDHIIFVGSALFLNVLAHSERISKFF
jgi:hypothetical protein